MVAINLSPEIPRPNEEMINDIIQHVYCEATNELHEKPAEEVIDSEFLPDSSVREELSQQCQQLVMEGHLSPRKTSLSQIKSQSQDENLAQAQQTKLIEEANLSPRAVSHEAVCKNNLVCYKNPPKRCKEVSIFTFYQ